MLFRSVMRFNGRYYLYPSSSEYRIKAFMSTDLVNWTYKGYVTETMSDFFLAYAPEVVYFNGKFYMITSPQGRGHYILKSDNPLGPFVPITGNFGYGIDGSFWVTDDNRLLLLYPEDWSIYVTEMDLNTMLPSHRSHKLNATLRHWTEGPGLFRRGDFFYLTYSGNHLLSSGYRVAYSYIKGNNPIGRYIMPENNIILIRSVFNDPFRGLGHNSNVIGPNLDSIYAPYHNLIAIPGPQRRYNLDRLLTNGGVLYSTGPTNFEVPVPSMPDIFGWLNEPNDVNTQRNFEYIVNVYIIINLLPEMFTA